jgi:hypothetical protein
LPAAIGNASQRWMRFDMRCKREGADMAETPGEAEPSRPAEMGGQSPAISASGLISNPASNQMPSQNSGASSAQAAFPAHVTFDRRELDRILNLYGRMVARGAWRDYAIDFLKDRAVFSIFRRASEVPIYRIEKNPRLARRQGIYSVISATGLILRRGHELDRVLRVLDKPVVATLT